MTPSVELQIGKRPTKNSTWSIACHLIMVVGFQVENDGLHTGFFCFVSWEYDEALILMPMRPVLLNWTHYDTCTEESFFLVICIITYIDIITTI